jgi:hypothetical protein
MRYKVLETRVKKQEPRSEKREPRAEIIPIGTRVIFKS